MCLDWGYVKNIIIVDLKSSVCLLFLAGGAEMSVREAKQLNPTLCSQVSQSATIIYPGYKNSLSF